MLACTAHTKLWVLSPALYKLGMVVDTRNTNTGEVEAMHQGFKTICDCKVSSRLAGDTQKPVSKTKQNIQNKKKPKVSVVSGCHSFQSLPLVGLVLFHHSCYFPILAGEWRSGSHPRVSFRGCSYQGRVCFPWPCLCLQLGSRGTTGLSPQGAGVDMCLHRTLRKLPSQVPLGSHPTLQRATAFVRTSQAWQGPGLPPSRQVTLA